MASINVKGVEYPLSYDIDRSVFWVDYNGKKLESYYKETLEDVVKREIIRDTVKPEDRVRAVLVYKQYEDDDYYRYELMYLVNEYFIFDNALYRWNKHDGESVYRQGILMDKSITKITLPMRLKLNNGYYALYPVEFYDLIGDMEELTEEIRRKFDFDLFNGQVITIEDISGFVKALKKIDHILSYKVVEK